MDKKTVINMKLLYTLKKKFTDHCRKIGCTVSGRLRVLMERDLNEESDNKR